MSKIYKKIDAGNYLLSSNQLSGFYGEITQLSSVTYVGPANGNWSDANNWAGGAIPDLSNVASVVIPSGTAVSYDSAVAGPVTSQVAANGSLSLSSAGGAVSLGGISGSGNIAMGANHLTLTAATAASGNFAGSISGGGGLTIASGDQILSGVNTYVGDTTISNGASLTISGSGVLGNGNYAGAITNNGSLSYASSANQALSGVISGSGSLDKTGTGTLVLEAANTYSGATTINGGTLAISNAGSLGSAAAGSGTAVNTGGTLDLRNVTGLAEPITLNGGTLAVSTGSSSVTSPMTITGASTMDVDGTQLTLSNTISGSGSLDKTGTGTLVLEAPNTFTGDTRINAGILRLAAGASISESDKVVVGTNAIFDTREITGNVFIESLAGSGSVLNGSIAPNSLVITDAKPSDVFSGVISGTGGFRIAGGTQTLTGINTYSGPTVVSPGANLIAAIQSIQGDVVNNGSFGFNQSTDGTYANNMSGTGSMVIGGTGTITLTGQNTQAGGTLIESGASVIIGAVNALSGNQIRSDNGSLGIANGITLSSLDVTGSVTLTSDIKTSGAQSYQNVKLAPSSGQLVTLETNNSDIRITGTLDGNRDKTQSLTINAGTAVVTFGDSVGSIARLNNLIVTGRSAIYILADVLTAMTQTYNGPVLIGNASFLGRTPTVGFLLNTYRHYFVYNSNGASSQIDYLNSNPIYIRTLISVDPEITFNGTVNDVVENTHTLLVAAIAPTTPAANPNALNNAAIINFNNSVGQDKRLYSLNVQTVLNSSQNNSDAYLGSINLTGNVTTYSSQTYRANLMTAKSNPQPGEAVFSVWDPRASINYLLPLQNTTNSNCTTCGQMNLQNPNRLDAIKLNGSNNFITSVNSGGVNNWGNRLIQGNALGYVPPSNRSELMDFAKFIQLDVQRLMRQLNERAIVEVGNIKSMTRKEDLFDDMKSLQKNLNTEQNQSESAKPNEKDSNEKASKEKAGDQKGGRLGCKANKKSNAQGCQVKR